MPSIPGSQSRYSPLNNFINSNNKDIHKRIAASQIGTRTNIGMRPASANTKHKEQTSNFSAVNNIEMSMA